MHNKSFRSLAMTIDEVITKLESVVDERPFDPGKVEHALKILGQGLGTIPAIIRIIDMISKR